STHLEPAVPLLFEIQKNIELALQTNTAEPQYASNAPALRDLLLELNNRVVSKSVTYDYLFSLPLRAGFLLTMIKVPMYAEFSFPEAFEIKSYSSHENFMSMIMRLENKKMPDGSDNIWMDTYTMLKAFPKISTLPFFGELSYRDINHLMAIGVWPTGMSGKIMRIDGRDMNEFVFPRHDRGHMKVAFEALLRAQELTPYERERMSHLVSGQSLVNIQRKILYAIERANLTELQKDLLHFIHFQIIHEKVEIFMIKDGKPTSEVSHKTVEDGFKAILKELNADMQADPEHYSGLADLISSVKEILRENPANSKELTKAVEIYSQFIESSVLL
ncbi:MAG: hypothetical protein AB7O96_08625, partial [Pseudobdellovibrionaceae bacterium]